MDAAKQAISAVSGILMTEAGALALLVVVAAMAGIAVNIYNSCSGTEDKKAEKDVAIVTLTISLVLIVMMLAGFVLRD